MHPRTLQPKPRILLLPLHVSAARDVKLASIRDAGVPHTGVDAPSLATPQDKPDARAYYGDTGEGYTDCDADY